MFKVTVINIKEMTKYFIGVSCAIFVVGVLAKLFSETDKNNILYNNTRNFIDRINEQSLIGFLNNELPGIDDINYETKLATAEDDHSREEYISDEILNMGLGKIYYGEDTGVAEKEENTEEKNDSQDSNENTKQEEIKTADTNNVKTEVITQNPLKNVVTNTFKLVNIKNESSYQLTNEILEPNISIDNKSILIFHTHTCESYTASEKYQYTPTGNFRTTDLNYSVSRVGDELEKYLKEYKIDVSHDKTYHDYPAYTGSYTRSLTTVKNLLDAKKSDIVIDLHRDAIGSNNGYAPVVKINDEVAAQIMMVIGTDGGGLTHPNWQNNLKFAVKLQEKAEEMYPGLFKTMIVRNSRYNQHLSKYANIIEVGATGNTLDQCLVSMKYLSSVFNEVLK